MNSEKPIPEVSLDDLISGITNHNKLLTAEAVVNDMRTEVDVYKTRIKFLEETGDKLALLMLNGTTAEIRQSIAAWRKLVPNKMSKEWQHNDL